MGHNIFILKPSYFNGPQPTQLKLDAGRLDIETGSGILHGIRTNTGRKKNVSPSPPRNKSDKWAIRIEIYSFI